MDAWDASGWDKGAGMLAIFMGQVISTPAPPHHDDNDDRDDDTMDSWMTFFYWWHFNPLICKKYDAILKFNCLFEM